MQYRFGSGIVLGGCSSIRVLQRLCYLCCETDLSIVSLPLDVVASAHYDVSNGCGSRSLNVFVLCSNMIVLLDSLMFFFDTN